MKELNDEIYLTISMMQSDLYEDMLDELRNHIVCLLEFKRNELQKRIVECSHAEHKPSTGLPESKTPTPKESWWAGYRVGKGLPANTPRQDAINAHAEPAKPLTYLELDAGGWWCGEVSEACRLAFIANGVHTEAEHWEKNPRIRCAYKLASNVLILRAHIPIDVSALKQIHRIGGNFYWSEK